jgi:peroxiredoxin Q/BCP
MSLFTRIGAAFFAMLSAVVARATDPPKAGSPAPQLRATTHDGKSFDLAERKGKGWTVLYFYPKADTPGCTKQACAFRDSIEAIRALSAEVYGISADDVKAIAAFHEKYHLSFPLLADPKGTVVEAWGVKMPALPLAKRWTFVVDPNLVVRQVFPNVDPVMDAKNVAEELKKLQGSSTPPSPAK